jgi:hypothetical protein
MTVRQLHAEIEIVLMVKDETAKDVALLVSDCQPCSYDEVLFAIRELKAAGRIIDIRGRLYLQAGDEHHDDEGCETHA